MPWRSSSIMDERIRFVIEARLGNDSISSLCAEFGISRQTGYRWLRRYKKTGSVTSLADRTSRPHSSPSRTPPEIEQRVIEARRHYGWGARKLHQVLLDQGLSLPASTIHNVLRRHGMIVPKVSHHPALQRFERDSPNQLWQMDFKGDYPVDGGRCYPLTMLDDHSRYSTGIFALPGQSTELVKNCLIKVFEKYGLPEAMLMDHGVPWFSTTNAHGLTRLSVWLIKHDVELIYGAVGHPQTRGKIERFHRTLADYIRFHYMPGSMAGWQSCLTDFQHEYNNVRPHESLEMATPATRYTASARSYTGAVRQWQYPVGATVKRLNTQGCLEYQRSRYFVCLALAGERVQVEHLDDKILVRFRRQYVREIELATRKTKAITDQPK
jgi:transposase InsO family protein